jgi:hypothetical protein
MANYCVFLQVMHRRLVKWGAPGPWTPESKQSIGASNELYMIWRYYWAAAQICGLTKADIGRQLKAE